MHVGLYFASSLRKIVLAPMYKIGKTRIIRADESVSPGRLPPRKLGLVLAQMRARGDDIFFSSEQVE